MKKPRDMSDKEYARWLHEECFLPYDEACRMSGYSPEAEYRRQTIAFLIGIVLAAGALVIASMLPVIAGVAK